MTGKAGIKNLRFG